jgi:putative aldouronate transport system substrate-binding protein
MNLRTMLLFLAVLSPAWSQTVSKTANDPLSFSVLCNSKEGTEFRADWLVVQEIARRKNVRLNVRPVPDNVYGKILGEVMSSSDIPDILLKIWPEQAASYAAAGILLPISDYEYLMPNLTRYIRENGLQGEVDKLRDESGKYHVLPGYQREIQVQQWIYRKDLFDKFGLSTPATYDELFQALVFLKGKYPESLPISACWGGAHLFAIMGANFGIAAGWNGDRFYDAKADRWVYSPATAGWKEMVRFLGKCYRAGLLDPEVFTQDPPPYYQKLVDGRTFVTVTWISSGFSTWNRQLAENGIAGGFWAPLMVPTSTVGIQALPAVNRFRKGAVVAARVIREPTFRKLIDFLDWIFYSQEGRDLGVWGVEGTTYLVSGGRKAFLPTIKSFAHPEASLDGGRDFGLNVMFDLCEVPDFEDAKKPPEIVDFLERTLSRNLTARMDPGLTLSANDLDTIKVFSDGLSSYVGGMIKSFVTGTADIDGGWKEYMNNLERKGSTTMEKIWNDAWRRRPNAPRSGG